MLRLNLTLQPASLDPAYARDQSMSWMVQQLYTTLVGLDSTLAPAPALALRWETSDSGRVYTFHLRSDVRFHPDACWKGEPRKVQAQDVVFSFTRICTPATASPGQWIFAERVRGVAEFQEGKAKTISGFRALNDSTFQVELVAPFPPFLGMLSMPFASIVPREAVETYRGNFGRNPVGSGAYRFGHWEDGQQLVLHRIAPGAGAVEAIQVRFIRSRLTAFEELKRGNIDWLEGLDPALKDELLTADGQLQQRWRSQVALYSGPQLTTEYIGIQQQDSLNTARPLLDRRVRQALSLAIDRQKLVLYLRNNMATPAHGLIPLGLQGNLGGMLEYNPVKAAALLTAAGYPNGKGLPVLKLVSSPAFQQQNEFLQSAWAQIGVQVEIENLEGATAREMIYQGQAQLWRASWVVDYPDAENFLALAYGPNAAPAGPNTTRFVSPAFDSVYHRAMQEPLLEKRSQLYQLADSLLATELPLIPLFYYRTVRLYNPQVRGLRNSAMDNYLDLTGVQKARR